MEETIEIISDNYLRISNKYSKIMHEIDLKQNEIISISERLEEIVANKISTPDEQIKAREKRKLLRQEIADLKLQARKDEGLLKWLLKVRIYD
tara:strand:+ start:1256 stop:1534 length:279 start_codon:yes stop_codon:yes gene_type:complete